MLQSEPGVSLYRQVKEEIESRIKTRIWKTGEQIPNEESLARQWGVSRGTVRQALQQLCNEGLLIRHQGRGTFVAEPRMVTFAVPDVFYRLTLDEDALRFRVISHDVLPAPEWVSQMLNLEPEKEVFTLRRLRLAGDRAASIKAVFLFPQEAEKMDSAALELPVIDFAVSRLGYSVGSVEVILEPLILNTTEIQILAEEPNTPGMRVIKRYMSSGGTPLVVSETILPSRFCRYHFTVPVVTRG